MCDKFDLSIHIHTLNKHVEYYLICLIIIFCFSLKGIQEIQVWSLAMAPQQFQIHQALLQNKILEWSLVLLLGVLQHWQYWYFLWYISYSIIRGKEMRMHIIQLWAVFQCLLFKREVNKIWQPFYHQILTNK